MKVFLVDDEIVVREGIRESFPWDDTSYVLVGEAPDGEMALPMIRDTNPDIVITDIKMPFMDGIELCRIMKTQMPWIGIIVLSGYDEFEYARQCIQLGVREYMLKPINSDALKETLDKVSEQLKAERNTFVHAASLRARMESGGKLVKEKLVGSLFNNEAAPKDAPDVLTQLSTMGCPVPAAFYTVIDAAFAPVEEGQAVADALSESAGVALPSPGRVTWRSGRMHLPRRLQESWSGSIPRKSESESARLSKSRRRYSKALRPQGTSGIFWRSGRTRRQSFSEQERWVSRRTRRHRPSSMRQSFICRCIFQSPD